MWYQNIKPFKSQINMQNKPIHLDTERKYRKDSLPANEEQQLSVHIEESDLLIVVTNKILEKDIVDYLSNTLLKLRTEIEAYSLNDKNFVNSLVPLVEVHPDGITPIINDMLTASNLLELGPFAAVAGSVAEYVAKSGHEYLKQKNLPDDIIVENGGDIFLISSKQRVIGLLDKPQDGCAIGIKVKPTKGISICTSSATIGHSLSFGRAELMTILAEKGCIADAAATSYCNMVQSSADFQKILDRVQKANNYNIIGIVASCDNELFAYGDIELVLI